MLLPRLEAAGNWTSDNVYHRTLADVNDGKVEVTIASAQAGYDALAATA